MHESGGSVELQTLKLKIRFLIISILLYSLSYTSYFHYLYIWTETPQSVYNLILFITKQCSHKFSCFEFSRSIKLYIQSLHSPIFTPELYSKRRWWGVVGCQLLFKILVPVLQGRGIATGEGRGKLQGITLRAGFFCL